MLTAKDLDLAVCDGEGCAEEHGPLYFHPKCHSSAGTWVKYLRGGIAVIECAECDEEVARLKIARV